MNQTRIFFFVASLLLAALGASVPGGASAQSVQDFQLPPNPSDTPSQPQVQGPVDEEVPAPAGPTVQPTPTPSAAAQNTPVVQPTRAPQLEVTPTPARTAAPPRPAATQQAPSRPAPQPTGSAEAVPETGSTAGVEAQSEAVDADGAGLPAAPSPEITAQNELDDGTAESASDFPWIWLAGIAALLAALAAFIFWRRKTTVVAPATIEPPKVAKPSPSATEEGEAGSTPAPDAAPVASTAASPAATSAEWLKIDARVSELQRSMMNATLRYKMVITNRSGSVLEDVSVEADLATAHNRLPVTEQLASAESPLTVRETIARMAPGERVELEGEIMIPLSQVKIITQGKALLCVPLLRMRVTNDASGKSPLARTWVIGRITPETQGKLNPFRFDAPPQTYSDIGARGLD